jgi:IPT/TIG domain
MGAYQSTGVDDRPTITAVSPSAGSQGGGTSVTITGTNFTGVTALTFGNTAATSFTVNSNTQITAVDPAETPGTVDITVTAPLGRSAQSSSDQFTYLGPVVTGLNPNTGPATGGTSVVITGTGFTNVAAVQFGSTAATSFTVNSSTQITAIVPVGAGVVDVTVTTSVGGTSATSSADVFTYSTAVIASTANVADSSATITINGAGFSTTPANNSVTFNLGVAGSVTSATTTQLTVTISTPPTALGSLTAVVTSNGLSSGAPVQVATEANGTWIVTNSSGSGGTLAAPTLPYAVNQVLSGDQITFASGLSGSTITLSNSLTISHNIATPHSSDARRPSFSPIATPKAHSSLVFVPGRIYLPHAFRVVLHVRCPINSE